MRSTPRLNRLFAADGKCFDVAIDHGFFGERTFLTGIESMPTAVAIVAAAAPDAIQLSAGMAHHLQSAPSPKPALVLRSDAANVYGPSLPEALFTEMLADTVGHAVRLDAACVVVNLFMLPGEPEIHRRCVRNIMDLRAQCDEAMMPLMVEPLIMKPNAEAGGYMVDGDIDKIMPAVRQAVELGADVIKADPTDDLDEFHRVVEVAAGVPVLVRGGGKAPISEILERTEAIMQQGAAGIVYGRNVVQHDDPGGMTRALMSIVHDGLDAAIAREYVAS